MNIGHCIILVCVTKLPYDIKQVEGITVQSLISCVVCPSVQ